MKRYRLEPFEFTEPEAVAAHLSGLAAKGLFLETVGAVFWVFRRGAPRKLTYAVTYFADASFYDGMPTWEQERLLDLCGAAGWQYVTQWHQMQIFCTDAANPVPLETDEAAKLRNIRQTMNQKQIPACLAMLILMLLLLLFSIRGTSLVLLLSSSIWIGFVLLMLALFLYEIWSLAGYGIWSRRAERAVAAGGRCPNRKPGGRRARNALLQAALAVFFLLVLTEALHSGSGVWQLGRLLLWLALVGLCYGIAALFKKRHSARKTTQVTMFVLVFACSILFSYVIPTGPSVTGPKDVPLALEDLGYAGVVDPDQSQFTHNHSFLMDHTRVLYVLRQPSGRTAMLDYTLFETDIPRLYRACRRLELASEVVPVAGEAAAPWQANEVYRFSDSSLFYIACYDTKVLSIRFEDPPDAGQIAAVVASLIAD